MDPAPPAKGRDRFRASRLDLFFLGITIVIGGQYFAWNKGLIGGFTQFFVGTLMMGFGYLNLVLCLAEMTSTLPFAGGTYGFVRVALGPFAGFLVGYCESILNVLYVTTAVMSLASMLSDLTQLGRQYEPIYWLVFFTISLYINACKGQLFWNTNAILALVSMVVLFIYIVGTAHLCDYVEYAAPSDAGFSTSEKVRNVFERIPLTAWWYVGVEMLPLTSRECSQPKKDIPVAMITCFFYLFISSIAVVFAVSNQAPGPAALSQVHAPLNFGFSSMFGISTRVATAFTIPATFATAFGFIYNYSRQLEAICMSGLVPTLIPSRYTSSTNQSLGYLLTGLTIALAILFTESYQSYFHEEDIFLVCILGGFLVYISLFASYVVFTTKFSSLRREFTNPLGYIGAAISVAIFGAASYSAVAMQPHRYAGASIAVFLLLTTAYYCFFARFHQRFSPEEQTILFSAYIINANVRTKLRRGKTRPRNLSAVLEHSKSLLGDLSSPFRHHFLRRDFSNRSGVSSPAVSMSLHSDSIQGSSLTTISHRQEQEMVGQDGVDAVRSFHGGIPLESDCVRPKPAHAGGHGMPSSPPPSLSHSHGDGQEGSPSVLPEALPSPATEKEKQAAPATNPSGPSGENSLSLSSVLSHAALDRPDEAHGSTIANLLVSTQAMLGTPNVAHLILRSNRNGRNMHQPSSRRRGDNLTEGQAAPSRWGILRASAYLTRKVVPSGEDHPGNGGEAHRDVCSDSVQPHISSLRSGQEDIVDSDRSILSEVVAADSRVMQEDQESRDNTPREIFLNTRSSLNFREQYTAIMQRLDSQHLTAARSQD